MISVTAKLGNGFRAGTKEFRDVTALQRIGRNVDIPIAVAELTIKNKKCRCQELRPCHHGRKNHEELQINVYG